MNFQQTIIIMISVIAVFCMSCTVNPETADSYMDLFKNIQEGSDLARGTSDAELSEQEILGLMFMREEEKLARDVYLLLYDLWGKNVFSNIASSEQTHTDSVKALIEKYGLSDPAASTGLGEFVDDELQQLYNDLIDSGSVSVLDALIVGALIEETDMVDIVEHMSHTEKSDILRVYGNLLNGSENHLRSFVKNLQKIGYDYSPQILSQEEFDAIINNE